MLKKLDRDDRMRLMKFVCSFAWADLDVQDSERAFVAKMIRSLELDANDTAQVEAWLDVPPRVEELDPNEIPKAHRELFLDAAKAIIVTDGKVDTDEAENLALLQMILGESDD